jgi:hypothetical protein
VQQSQFLRDQLVPVHARSLAVAAVKPNDRHDALLRFEISEPPLLVHIVRSDRSGAHYQDEPVATLNGVADLLIEGELPRGHANAIEPDAEPRRGQVLAQTAHELLIVAPSVGEKNRGHVPVRPLGQAVF